MKKILLTGIFILLFCGFTFSQCNSFKVFHYSGKVYASHTNKKQPVVLDQVIKGGSVSLETSAQLIMFDSTGKPVVLDQKGNYSFRQLQTKCAESDNSITAKYFHFIWSCMYEEKKKNRNTPNASVTREENLLMIFPIDGSLIIADSVTFLWNRRPGITEYYITILDPSGKTITASTVTDTIFTWFPETGKLVSGKMYHWSVSVDRYPPVDPVRYSFSLAGNTQKKSYSAELNKFRKLLNYTPAINSLLLAGFYEQKNLFGEAYNSYHKALVASPGDSVIRKVVNDFMKRQP
ncbi:MAG: hypothetical protein NTX61_05495 [Bacteroidetes bacterium]|nr:hypothetical protein [Bacteroidota bacterium]